MLQREEKLLLDSARLHLNTYKISELNDQIQKFDELNWKQFIEITFRSGVSSLIYKNLSRLPDKDVIPSSFMARLKKRYIQLYFKNTKQYEDFEEVIRLLNSNQIEFVPLKGMFLTR